MRIRLNTNYASQFVNLKAGAEINCSGTSRPSIEEARQLVAGGFAVDLAQEAGEQKQAAEAEARERRIAEHVKAVTEKEAKAKVEKPAALDAAIKAAAGKGKAKEKE